MAKAARRSRVEKHFFWFTTSAIVVVLALTFQLGVEAGLATISSRSSASVTWLVIELNILLLLVEILWTMAHVHHELDPPVRYRRWYLLLDLLLVTLPLYFAAEAVALAFRGVRGSIGQMQSASLAPLRIGLCALAATMVFLAVRTAVGLSGMDRTVRSRYLPLYLFYAAGTGLTIIAAVRPEQTLGLAIAGLIASLAFLVFLRLGGTNDA